MRGRDAVVRRACRLHCVRCDVHCDGLRDGGASDGSVAFPRPGRLRGCPAPATCGVPLRSTRSARDAVGLQRAWALERVVVVWTGWTGQTAFVDVGAAIDTLCVTESGTRGGGLATDAIAVVAAATRRVLCRVSGVLGAGGVKCCAAAPGGLLALHGLDPTLQSTTR